MNANKFVITKENYILLYNDSLYLGGQPIEPLNLFFLSVEYNFKNDKLLFNMPDGDTICITDAGINNTTAKILYLDQRDWSAIAKINCGLPNRIPQDEATAYRKIIQAVKNKKIILPFSSGHIIETMNNSKEDLRFALSKSILSLSNGWIMHSISYVRRQEILNSLSSLNNPISVFSKNHNLISSSIDNTQVALPYFINLISRYNLFMHGAESESNSSIAEAWAAGKNAIL